MLLKKITRHTKKHPPHRSLGKEGRSRFSGVSFLCFTFWISSSNSCGVDIASGEKHYCLHMKLLGYFMHNRL